MTIDKPPKITAIAVERRKEILEAATACFARRGFHLTTMAEICAEAKMSPGSVYRYFRSKEDIIAAQAEQDREVLVHLFAEAESFPTFEETLLFLMHQIDGVYSDRGTIVLTLESTAEATRNEKVKQVLVQTDAVVRELLERMFVRAQQAGELDPTLDIPQTIKLLIAVYDGMAMRRAFEEVDSESFYQAVSTMARRYLQLVSRPGSS